MSETRKPYLIIVFPDLVSYPDRSEMFRALANLGWQGHLFSQNAAASFTIPGMTIIHDQGKYRGMDFGALVFFRLFLLIGSLQPDRAIIIHEFFRSSLAPLLKRIFRNRSIHAVVSYYAANAALLKSKGWRYRDRPTSPLADFTYLKMLSRRMIGEWYACKTADLLTGNSPEIIEDFRRHFAVKESKLVHWPSEIDTGFFRPPIERVRRAAKRIITTGRILYRRKGIDVLLEAFRLVKNKYPDCELALVGAMDLRDAPVLRDAFARFPYKDAIRQFVAGNRQALVEAYHSADLFVSASINEGCPRSVKEAMACGLPVLLSDIPGHRAIDPDGEVAYFFPVDDPKALAALLCGRMERIEESRARANEGIELIRRSFSPESVAASIAAIYGKRFSE